MVNVYKGLNVCSNMQVDEYIDTIDRIRHRGCHEYLDNKLLELRESASYLKKDVENLRATLLHSAWLGLCCSDLFNLKMKGEFKEEDYNKICGRSLTAFFKNLELP